MVHFMLLYFTVMRNQMRNNTYAHTYNAFSDTVYSPGEEGLIMRVTGSLINDEQMVLLVSCSSIAMETVSSDRVDTASPSWQRLLLLLSLPALVPHSHPLKSYSLTHWQHKASASGCVFQRTQAKTTDTFHMITLILSHQ